MHHLTLLSLPTQTHFPIGGKFKVGANSRLGTKSNKYDINYEEFIHPFTYFRWTLFITHIIFYKSILSFWPHGMVARHQTIFKVNHSVVH